MSIYLISQNVFFNVGVRELIERECGVKIKIIKIESLVILYEQGFVDGDDLFLVAVDDFNTTLSTLVMLRYFSNNIYVLPYNKNYLEGSDFFSLPFNDEVGKEYIKSIVVGNGGERFLKEWELTSREATVLSYRLRGVNVYSISCLLSLNIKTIYTHQKNALRKLGIRTFGHLHML